MWENDNDWWWLKRIINKLHMQTCERAVLATVHSVSRRYLISASRLVTEQLRNYDNRDHRCCHWSTIINLDCSKADRFRVQGVIQTG